MNSTSFRKRSTMLRKLSFFGVILVCSVFVLIFISNRLILSSTFEYINFQNYGKPNQTWSLLEESSEKEVNTLFYTLSEENITAEITSVVNEQREKIKNEMKEYKYMDKTNGSSKYVVIFFIFSSLLIFFIFSLD